MFSWNKDKLKEEINVLEVIGVDDEFLTKKQRKRKKKLEELKKMKEEKLFMEFSWSQQRREGASSKVLRQMEGDTLNNRLSAYHQSIFFHLHASLDHNAYIIHRIRSKKQDVNAKDEKGRTALHYAARYGAKVCVNTLLKEDACVDDPDVVMRWTPLHFAVKGNHRKIITLILESSPTVEITLNRKDKSGMTPLMLAAAEGHSRVVKLLLEEGADVDEVDNEGWNALHYAALNDSLGSAEYLYAYDINIDHTTKDTNETAYDIAERIKSHTVAIFLYDIE